MSGALEVAARLRAPEGCEISVLVAAVSLSPCRSSPIVRITRRTSVRSVRGAAALWLMAAILLWLALD
jgi:hypothetical protein